MVIMLLLLAWTVCIPLTQGERAPGQGTQTVNRINYGLVFDGVGELDNSASVWRHTYQFVLPDSAGFDETVIECVDDKNYTKPEIKNFVEQACNQMQDLMTRFYVTRIDTVASINCTNRMIKDLIPNTPIVRKSRRRRQILSIVGKWSRSIFGTAMLSDVKALEKHMVAMTNENMALSHAFQEHTDLFTSFMTSTDERFSLAMEGITNNKQLVEELAMEFSSAKVSWQYVFTSVIASMAKEILLHAQVGHALVSLEEATHQLIRHQLPPFLVPVSLLNDTFNKIELKLKSRYNGQYKLATKSPEYYYSRNVVFGRTDNKLYITVTFPMTSGIDSFTVYYAYLIPMPLNQTSSHATQLAHVNKYIAIDTSSGYFIELDDADTAVCTKGARWHCPHLLPQRSVVDATCLSALFLEQTKQINDLCEYSIVPNGVKPFMREINDGEILITNIPTLTLTCGTDQKSEKKVIQGCTQCVLPVPCHCSVSAGPFIIPARFSNCDPAESAGRLFPVNLPLIQALVEDEATVAKIQSNTLYHSPPTVLFQNFSLYDNKYEAIIAANQKSHINMKEAVARSKQNQAVYKYLSDPILNGEWLPLSTQNEWTTGPTILSFVNFAMTLVCICILVALSIRFRVLLAALALNARPVEARDIRPQLNIFSTLAATTTTEKSNVNPTIIVKDPGFEDHLHYILFGILLMMLIYKIFVIKKRSFCKTTIYLEVTNGTKCARVMLMKLPQCPEFLHIDDEGSSFEDPHIQYGFPFSYLTYRAPGLQITNKLNNRNLNLSTKIKIGPITTLKVHNILLAQYNAYLVCTHMGQAVYHPLQLNIQLIKDTVKEASFAKLNDQLKELTSTINNV